MKLRELLASVKDIVELPEHPALDMEIQGLTTNSHAASPGDVFIGMPGTRVDGGEFWESAIGAGAIAAVISEQAAQKIPPLAPPNEGGEEPCIIVASDMTKACAKLAAAFYGYPGHAMRRRRRRPPGRGPGRARPAHAPPGPRRRDGLLGRHRPQQAHGAP